MCVKCTHKPQLQRLYQDYTAFVLKQFGTLEQGYKVTLQLIASASLSQTIIKPYN